VHILKHISEYTNTDKEKEERLLKAENDFLFFSQYYLFHYFSHKPAPYQKILMEIINTKQLKYRDIEKLKNYVWSKYHKYLKPMREVEGIIDIEPRGHGKTSRLSLAYPLWVALFKKKNFIIIFGSSQEMASLNLMNIKKELEENERILNDFGDVKGNSWTKDYLELKTDVAFLSRGANSSSRGLRFKNYRPDLIILDDVLKDTRIHSSNYRKSLYEWFKKVIIPLGKDAFIIVVNTILHYDDLPSKLLKEVENKTFTKWLALRFSAIKENKKSLWAHYWSLESLEQQKKQIGSHVFACEFMNEPSENDGNLFKKEWISYYNSQNLVIDQDIIIGIDPSAGVHDLSALVVVMKKDSYYYVIDSYGKNMSVDEFIHTIITFYQRYKPKYMVFEDVAFQKIYKELIYKEASRQGIHLPLKGINPKGKAKYERLISLSASIENKLIQFEEKNNRDLINQLIEFPKSEYDDLLDALFYSIEQFSQNNKPIVYYSSFS